MKANRALLVVCLISLASNAYAGKDKEKLGSSKIVIFCAALFGGGCIVYKVYEYMWGHPEWEERVRRIDARVDTLVESSAHLESDVGVVKKKVGIIDQRTEQIQVTQSEHGNKLNTLDHRAQEMTDHLLAIRKKQAEHSEALEGLRQQLVKLYETGAQKNDIERCETAIKELMSEHYLSLTTAFDHLKASQHTDLTTLKDQLLQGNTQELDALEKRLTKLVATESFIAQRCDQLKDELREQIKESIREEFNHQRTHIGLEQRPSITKKAQLIKATAS